jgi:LAS superfamily LD-carboxypeptidase LdcB
MNNYAKHEIFKDLFRSLVLYDFPGEKVARKQGREVANDYGFCLSYPEVVGSSPI